MPVNYGPTPPVPGQSRAASPTEVDRWTDYADTIADVDTRLDVVEADTTAADLAAHIGDSTDAHDASAVSIVDAGGYFTGTDVEAALQEIGAGGGGGGGGDVTVIGEQVLAATAASVDFSSIPGTYRSLRLVVQARGTAASTAVSVTLRFNGDSAANYITQQLRANSATVSGAGTISVTSAFAGAVAGSTAPAGMAGVCTIDIPNYAGTTWHKDVLAVTGHRRGTAASDIYMDHRFSSWANTAAITQVTVLPDSGSWAAGSMFTLYGFATL